MNFLGFLSSRKRTNRERRDLCFLLRAFQPLRFRLRLLKSLADYLSLACRFLQEPRQLQSGPDPPSLRLFLRRSSTRFVLMLFSRQLLDLDPIASLRQTRHQLRLRAAVRSLDSNVLKVDGQDLRASCFFSFSASPKALPVICWHIAPESPTDVAGSRASSASAFNCFQCRDRA